MLVGMWEKFSWAIACLVLAMMGRIPTQVTAMGMIDLILGLLFVVAWEKTSSSKMTVYSAEPKNTAPKP
jgi:hypothetical protein